MGNPLVLLAVITAIVVSACTNIPPLPPDLHGSVQPVNRVRPAFLD